MKRINSKTKRSRSGNASGSIFKSEVKSLSLGAIMNDELKKLNRKSFLEQDNGAQVNEEEDDTSIFYQTIDQNYNYKLSPEFITHTKYAWAHISCASFVPEVKFTFRSAIKLNNMKES